MTSTFTKDTAPAAFIHPTDHAAPLYIPRRSQDLPGDVWTTYPAPIPAAWTRIAAGKGYRIHRRIRDRYHVALECPHCGAHKACKVFNLRTAQPSCGGCATGDLNDHAKHAGLSLLYRDPLDRHYGIFRAGCGHDVRRQFEFVERLAARKTTLRCETCQNERDAREAQARGLVLLGPDMSGDPNYRQYRHDCGHIQRIARANVLTGRFDCGGCGAGWAAKPSVIYLAKLTFHDTGLRVLKLGYSANPKIRFKQQLGLSATTEVVFLRLLPMRTGQAACAMERGLHVRLARDFPESVIPADAYADLINVVSEIYCHSFLPTIHHLLDGIAQERDQAR